MFRGNWGISRQNSNGPRLIPDDEFADDDYDDHHASNARSVAFCRSVALLVSLFTRFKLQNLSEDLIDCSWMILRMFFVLFSSQFLLF